MRRTDNKPKSTQAKAKLSTRATAAKEEEGPGFADLAASLSAVLNNPQTPVDVYNALADQVIDLCNPYFQAIHETPAFIEEALIFAAKGEAESTPETKTDEQQRAELARLLHVVFNHPALPAILSEEFQRAYINFENSGIDLEAVSQTPAAIKHALDLAAEKGGAKR